MLLSGLLMACSPQYNWRQLTVGAGAATAFFPDKPVTQERSLKFSGHDIAYGMASATVDDTLFTVAYAVLPEALQKDEASRNEFAAAVVGSLYRNLGQEPPATLPASGDVFTVEGKSTDGAIKLQARAWLTDQGLVQGIVTAARDRFPAPQAAEFLQGVEPGR
jgi:hypothetical protein